jgi:trans-2,3-dihydro-3-hydroxyanthranilate isomerase
VRATLCLPGSEVWAYERGMRYAFRIVNVFTVGDDRFSGNPLCVFEDARGLTDVQMQALARQMNLSETTFVLPGEANPRVRIFTQGFEMLFAGHPTLGTASVVATGDEVTLEMIAGHVEVKRVGADWMLRAAQPPTTRRVDATRAELAAMVGLPADAVCDEPLWVSTGVEQLVIPIASPELVRSARPQFDLLEKHGFSATRQEAMAYLWARGEPARDQMTVRFFFTLSGSVIEDPATGSACANLGGWFVTMGGTPITATLRQGDAVQRPSRLVLRVDPQRNIYVSGSVIELGRGTVDV